MTHSVNYTTYLHKVPILSKLKEEELELLLEGGRTKIFPKNSVVFNEGDLEDGLYIVLSGKAKAMLMDPEGRELTLSVFGPGDFLGEMAIFDEQPRSATIETIEETTFLVLPKETVHSLIRRNPTIAIAMLTELSLRLREADDKIRTLAYYDVAGRLARILIDLLKKEGKVVKQKNIAYVKLPPSQELANMVGASRETISRVLSSLQRRGVISVTRNHLVIHNVSELI